MLLENSSWRQTSYHLFFSKLILLGCFHHEKWFDQFGDVFYRCVAQFPFILETDYCGIKSEILIPSWNSDPPRPHFWFTDWTTNSSCCLCTWRRKFFHINCNSIGDLCRCSVVFCGRCGKGSIWRCCASTW